MLSTIRSTLAATAFAAAAATAPIAQAGPFPAMYVFGDSTVDTGNVLIASGGVIPASPPYFAGRFSNGPLWIDWLAAGLGLTADVQPALGGGRNFAFATARIATPSAVPSVQSQIADLFFPSLSALPDPNALYVISAGSNDMRDARDAFPGITAADDAGRAAAAQAAISNLNTFIGVLSLFGAKHFLVPNLVDLGATPEVLGLGLEAASSDAAKKFNDLLASLETLLDASGLDVTILDLASLASTVTNDALFNAGGFFGITNVTTPCGDFTGSVGISCDVSLYSDNLHPSAIAGFYAGAAALQALGAVGSEPPAEVPAPETALLMLAALAILIAGNRGRSVARSRATA